MKKTSTICAIAVASLTLMTSVAVAAPSTGNTSMPLATAVAEGKLTLAPLAFVRFCMDNPAECQSRGQGERIVLDERAWRVMNEVNGAVNARITPDPATAAQHAWSLTTDAGDCNDYAVQKRQALIKQGWPSGALSLAVVMTTDGVGHLVLTARTNRGDLVLDNLRSSVVAWNSTNYRWIKQQSAAEPRYWVENNGGHAIPDSQLTVRVLPETSTMTASATQVDLNSWNLRFN